MAGKSKWSALQSVVALVAGLSSICGAAYSAVVTFLPASSSGEIVAVVREASSGQPVRAAVVEVRTPQDALVTTMTQGDDGLARHAVAPGVYRVRAIHPDFVEAARDVEVPSSGTAEVRLALARRVHQVAIPTPAPHVEPPHVETPHAQASRAPVPHGDPVMNGAQVVDRHVHRWLSRFGF